MFERSRWGAYLLVLPLALAPVACGDAGADERAALEEDELGRELDLALQGDTTPASFEDTPSEEAPEAEPEPEPPPARTPPRQEQPAPRPEPPPARPREPEPAPPPAPREVTSSVAIGTTMSVTLNDELSTETNQAGDSFTATVQQPITDSDGNVVIPTGGTVRGRVTQVQKSGRVGETAVLNLAFEAVSFGGESYPLDASVVETNPEKRSRSSTGEQAAKVGAGAAAGAILGRILGKDTKGAVVGGVIGAAAGTAVALGTDDVDAVLPVGSTMIIRVESPVTVTRTVS